MAQPKTKNEQCLESFARMIELAQKHVYTSEHSLFIRQLNFAIEDMHLNGLHNHGNCLSGIKACFLRNWDEMIKFHELSINDSGEKPLFIVQYLSSLLKERLLKKAVTVGELYLKEFPGYDGIVVRLFTAYSFAGKFQTALKLLNSLFPSFPWLEKFYTSLIQEIQNGAKFELDGSDDVFDEAVLYLAQQHPGYEDVTREAVARESLQKLKDLPPSKSEDLISLEDLDQYLENHA